jgi:ABC-type transport system involved in multi-copper enzyme maturation permease subunit
MSAGIPFERLVRTELRKLVDTRAGRWLLIVTVATTFLIVPIMLLSAAPKDLTYDRIVDFVQTPQKILLPALGVLAITSEWSQRTGLVTFTLVPGRGRVLVAKIVATMLLGLAAILLCFGAAAIGNVLGIAFRHADGSWAFGVTGFRDITLVLLMGLLEGMAFGMLLLISAAAIVLYYTLPNASGVLFGAVPALKGAAPWVDINHSQSPLYSHEMSGETWAQLLISATLWIVLPLAVGVIRVLRSEVRST